jgi:hypothetical protein
MGSSVNRDAAKYRCPHWRFLIVVLAICGLTVSVATRTFHLKILQCTTVTSHSAPPMRQHLDRDAMRWVAPIPVFIVFEAPTFYLPMAPAAPSLPSVLFDESLSNRPPPSPSC